MLDVNLTETFDVSLVYIVMLLFLQKILEFINIYWHLFQGDVYMYYGLSNFYQNHRRYVKSRDDHQLLGALGDVSNECSPFDRVPVEDPARNTTAYKQVVPCGAIANSLFNGNFCLNVTSPFIRN